MQLIRWMTVLAAMTFTVVVPPQTAAQEVGRGSLAVSRRCGDCAPQFAHGIDGVLARGLDR
jgi:hypothetical protein